MVIIIPRLELWDWEVTNDHLVSDMIEGAQEVGGAAEELHPPALLVLQLGGDGGPVRDQPGGENCPASSYYYWLTQGEERRGEGHHSFQGKSLDESRLFKP